MQKSNVTILLLFVIFLFFLGHAFALSESGVRKKIVSLVPAITEELFLLGVEDRVIGVTVYCQRPPAAQKKERVGTVVEINVEKILELNPDMVIASPLTDRRQLAKLKGLGISVEVFEAVKDFRGLCDSFLKISRIVGKEEKAVKIISKAQRALDDQQKDLESLPAPRVFVQIGANPLFTSGRDTIIDEMIKWAGGENVAHNVKGWSIYSREEVIKNNPDIVLIVTMGTIREKERETWLRYNVINAVRNKRIYVVDTYRVCSPTPISFVEMVKELVRYFHGK
jgi:iron complex transport system substrate-binding protein